MALIVCICRVLSIVTRLDMDESMFLRSIQLTTHYATQYKSNSSTNHKTSTDSVVAHRTRNPRGTLGSNCSAHNHRTHSTTTPPDECDFGGNSTYCIRSTQFHQSSGTRLFGNQLIQTLRLGFVETDFSTIQQFGVTNHQSCKVAGFC